MNPNRRSDAVVIGVDIGTTNSKAVACLQDGTVVAQAVRAHGVTRPVPGHVEHDAEAVWWGDTVELCRELVSVIGDGDRIRGLAVTTCGPCIVPVDGAGDPLRPGILYGVDTRATDEIALMDERIGPGATRRMGGMPLTSQSVGPKLAWVARHEPEVARRTAAWHTATSFIVARLSGVAAIDHHQASYFAPFIDSPRRAWDVRHAASIGLAGLAGALPQLRWPNEIAGTVTAASARATGLPEGLPVLVGTSDGPMEALALGATRPGIVAITYGSTTALTALGAARPSRSPRDVWLTEGITPDRPCLSTGLATTGTLLAWLAGLLAPDIEAPAAVSILEREAATSPPGSRGVSVLPSFAGGPASDRHPAARGVIAGLTLAHGRGDIARAALEGIAFGVQEALEALVAAGVVAERLHASGGGTANKLALQIVSDVSGLDQDLAAPPAGAAVGAARLVAEAVDLVSPSAEWFVADRRIETDTSSHPIYDEAFRRYRRLSDSVQAVPQGAAAIAAGAP